MWENKRKCIYGDEERIKTSKQGRKKYYKRKEPKTGGGVKKHVMQRGKNNNCIENGEEKLLKVRERVYRGGGEGEEVAKIDKQYIKTV